MKKFYYFMLLCLCALTATMISCGGDDDDDKGGSTGDGLHNKIVGTWTISCVKHTQGTGKAESIFYYWKEGTQIVFRDNGTYTDTSNSGSHKWDTNQGKDNNLDLDGYEFHVEIWGGNAEVTYYSDEDIWIFCWVKGEISDNPSDPEDPSDPVTPDPPKENSKYRVKSIKHYTTYEYRGMVGDWVEYSFDYDSEGKIKTYRYGNSAMEFTSYGNTLIVDGNYQLNCELKDDRVVSIDWAWLNNVDHFDITYNKQGYPSLISYPREGNAVFGYQGYTFNVTRKDGLKFTYAFSNEKNDMNINLNAYLMSTYIYMNYGGKDSAYLFLGNPIEFLLPFDYLGRYEYLIMLEETPPDYDSYYDNLEVTRDKNNLITQMKIEWVSRSGYSERRYQVYDIGYEEYK